MSTITMLRARDIMARDIVTLHPDTNIIEAIGLLLDRNISGAPVVDDDSRLLGLLSEVDCLRVMAFGAYADDAHETLRTVAAFMSTAPRTIGPDRAIYSIASDFLTLRVRRLPVVEHGRLAGQVSRRDVLRGIERMMRAGHRFDAATPRPPGLYLSTTDADPGVIATRNR